MRQPKGSNQFSGFLDQGTILKGELSFSGAVRIDGIIQGSITTADLLIVGAGAEVEANVSVGEIEIYGDLKGDIDSSVRVTVHAGGHLKGNVSTPRLVIEDGAEFDGVSRTVSKASEPQVQAKVVPEAKVASPKTVAERVNSPEAVDSNKAVDSGKAVGSRKAGGSRKASKADDSSKVDDSRKENDSAVTEEDRGSVEPAVPVDMVLQAEDSESSPSELETAPKARWSNIGRSMHKRWTTVMTTMARRD